MSSLLSKLNFGVRENKLTCQKHMTLALFHIHVLKKKIIKGSFHSENGFTIHFNFLQGPSDFRERLI